MPPAGIFREKEECKSLLFATKNSILKMSVRWEPNLMEEEERGVSLRFFLCFFYPRRARLFLLAKRESGFSLLRENLQRAKICTLSDDESINTDTQLKHVWIWQ